MKEPNYLSAKKAARRLGISRQTLYAYVSRGLLRSHEGDDPRRRRYAAEDIERLAAERHRGRRPKEIAKATLDWGLPVLESAITLIRDQRIYYRGIDAVELAQAALVEDAAALLWNLPVTAAFPPAPPTLPATIGALAEGSRHLPPEEALVTLFSAVTSDHAAGSWQDDPGRLAEGCGALVRALLSLMVGAPPDAAPLHQQIAKAWTLDQRGAEIIRMALILCADHELNASTFTARCVASTGASLRAAVIGGLSALTGGRHGGMTVRVENFWNGLAEGDPMMQLRRRLAAGEALPGFGHPLYPDGDPRAKALLARITPDFSAARVIGDAAEELTGRKPSLDFALVALRRHLELPEGSAFGLFALGRSIGWIAHALEQRTQGQLIRPRAIYTGPEPVMTKTRA